MSVPLCIQLCAEEDEFVDHEEEQEFDEYDDEEMQVGTGVEALQLPTSKELLASKE